MGSQRSSIVVTEQQKMEGDVAWTTPHRRRRGGGGGEGGGGGGGGDEGGCRHRPCKCSSTEAFCSKYCTDAAKRGSNEACRCGHTACA